MVDSEIKENLYYNEFMLFLMNFTNSKIDIIYTIKYPYTIELILFAGLEVTLKPDLSYVNYGKFGPNEIQTYEPHEIFIGQEYHKFIIPLYEWLSLHNVIVDRIRIQIKTDDYNNILTDINRICDMFSDKPCCRSLRFLEGSLAYPKYVRGEFSLYRYYIKETIGVLNMFDVFPPEIKRLILGFCYNLDYHNC